MKNRRKRLAILLGAALLLAVQNGGIQVRAEVNTPAAFNVETSVGETENPNPKVQDAVSETKDDGASVQAAEAVSLEADSKLADNDENTVQESEDEKESQSNTLDKATDLKWETSKKGYATFIIPNEKGTASYKIDLWCDDKRLFTYDDNAYDNEEKGTKIELFFFHYMDKSGTYKFQVTTLNTDGKPVNEIFSPELKITLADEQLPVPQDISWDEAGRFSCKRPAHDQFLQYAFKVYRPDGSMAGSQFGSPYVADIVSVTENEGGITFDLNEYLGKNGITVENGYSVQVQAVSKNFEECRDSDWSDRVIYGQAPSKPNKTDNNDGNGSSYSEPVAVEVWKPTTPDEIKRYAFYSREKVEYTTDVTNAYPVVINNAMQGKLCFDSFEAVLGDYIIGRTYDITPSGKTVYKMNSKARITLSIPKSLQAVGREYKMICVTEKGQPIVLDDLDSNATTITFETDTYHAFALVYRNAAAPIQ